VADEPAAFGVGHSDAEESVGVVATGGHREGVDGEGAATVEGIAVAIRDAVSLVGGTPRGAPSPHGDSTVLDRAGRGARGRRHDERVR
jgi:hypothetical protein